MTAPGSGGEYVVAVDVGGTKIAAAPVDRAGSRGETVTVPTPARDGPEAVLDAAARVVARARDGRQVRAVGVGSAGTIDRRRGTVVAATDALPGWSGTDLVAGLRTRTGLPVTVDNDANAHAAGETWLGAAAGADRVLMVAVGTGVGGAIVLDGRPLGGARHVAGDLAHVPVAGAEHLRCGCGRVGHLESIASGPGLVRHYHWLGGCAGLETARDVLAAADGGHADAERAVRESAQVLGRGVAAAVSVLDPDLVVVGGGLAGAGPRWWEAMERTLRAELVEALAAIPIVPARLGIGAALVGAARDAWRLVDAPTHGRGGAA